MRLVGREGRHAQQGRRELGNEESSSAPEYGFLHHVTDHYAACVILIGNIAARVNNSHNLYILRCSSHRWGFYVSASGGLSTFGLDEDGICRPYECQGGRCAV